MAQDSKLDKMKKNYLKIPVIRRGFTLVELLVVVAIIGILIGMLLPAVQQVREAARRTVCMNNVRQLALAAHNYHGAFDALPTQYIGPVPASGGVGHGYYSWMVWLLPFMEQNNLYDSIDIRVNLSSNLNASGGFSPMSWQLNADHPNAAAANTQISTFICPSGNVGHQNAAVMGSANPASGSYAANMGWIPSASGYQGERPTPGEFNGVFAIHQPTFSVNWHPHRKLKLADIHDGTSNTCMISERLVQQGQSIAEVGQSEQRLRSFHISGRAPRVLAALDDICSPASTHSDIPYSAFLGRAWISGWPPAGNMYVHLKTPNTNNGHIGPSFSTTNSSEAQGDFIVTPSSNHHGGVIVCLADASTRFVPNDVDRNTWWALGSSNSGDLVGSF